MEWAIILMRKYYCDSFTDLDLLINLMKIIMKTSVYQKKAALLGASFIALTTPFVATAASTSSSPIYPPSSSISPGNPPTPTVNPAPPTPTVNPAPPTPTVNPTPPIIDNGGIPAPGVVTTNKDFEIRQTSVDSSLTGRNCVSFPFKPTDAVVTAVLTDMNGREHAVRVPSAELVGKTLYATNGKTSYFIQKTEQNVCVQHTADSNMNLVSNPNVLVGSNNTRYVKYYVKAYK